MAFIPSTKSITYITMGINLDNNQHTINTNLFYTAIFPTTILYLVTLIFSTKLKHVLR